MTYYHESRTLWIPKTRSGGNRAPVTFCNVQQNVWRSLVFRAAVLWTLSSIAVGLGLAFLIADFRSAQIRYCKVIDLIHLELCLVKRLSWCGRCGSTEPYF